MSVNGSGTDRKTNKPSDPTSWTVKVPGTGAVALDSKRKPLTGLNAVDAFAAIRSARRRSGEYLVAVRT